MLRFPPQKILVAFDRTPVSLPAWSHAADLARRFGSTLEAVYVEPLQTPGVGLYPVRALTPARARELRAAVQEAVGAAVKVHVTEGDPALRIVGVARRTQAELIVMGTHGRSGAMRLLLGSVAEEVLRASPVPVLVVRGRPRPVRRVLAPVNFASYSRRGLDFAAQAAAALQARLTLLHVDGDPVWSGNPRRRLPALAGSLPESLRRDTEVIADEDAARGIRRGAKGHELIVLVEHEKSLLRDLVLGTTAERVLRRSRKPLLAIPAPRRARVPEGPLAGAPR